MKQLINYLDNILVIIWFKKGVGISLGHESTVPQIVYDGAVRYTPKSISLSCYNSYCKMYSVLYYPNLL